MNKAQIQTLHLVKQLRERRTTTAVSNARVAAETAETAAIAALNDETHHKQEQSRRQCQLLSDITDHPSTLAKFMSVADEVAMMAVRCEQLRMRRSDADRGRTIAAAALADAAATHAKAARAMQVAADLVCDCTRTQERREEAETDLEMDDLAVRLQVAYQP